MEVVILGAYGHVGKIITKHLARMEFIDKIIAVGRNQEKLEHLKMEIKVKKIDFRVMDAFNFMELGILSKNKDLVINCIGPYLWRGSEIAETVIDQETNYLDFANEQEHYRRLQKLNKKAIDNNVSLITGVGTSPGVSTMLYQMGKEKVPDATEAAMYYATGRHPSRDEGLGSVVGAILDNAYGPLGWINNSYKKVTLGKEFKTTDMPEPFGSIKMMAFPTIDALIVPKIFEIENIRTFWALGDVPFYLNFLTWLLKPHKRRWAYNLFKKIAIDSLHTDFDKFNEKSIGTESWMKVVVNSSQDSFESLISFPDGGGEAAAYTALLVAKKLLEGSVVKKGLVALNDNIITPNELFDFMKNSGWKGTLKTNDLKGNL